MLPSACGFRPVHGPADQSHLDSNALNFIAVDSIPDRSGQILQVALEDGIHPEGRQPENTYRLSVDLQEIKQPIIIERNGRISRYNLIHVAKFRVYNPYDNATLHSGTAKRISSYNVSLSDFSTFIAEREGHERGLTALAQDIIMQLASAFEPKQASGS